MELTRRNILLSLGAGFLCIATFAVMSIAFWVLIVYTDMIETWKLGLIFYTIMVVAIGCFFAAIWVMKFIKDPKTNTTIEANATELDEN